MPTFPTILHVDLDAFFAAVEQRDDPRLRGVPVLVGGSSRRGVVAAASYEARAFGVHSAMPMARALRLCPRAVVVSHNFGRYREASEQFFEILRAFTPLVEPLSIDEAFLDVASVLRLHGDPLTIARSIKSRVFSELSLRASVGVAPTKFAAKIASDIDKPDGLHVVPADGLLDFLHPLPASRLWGVGAATGAQLSRLGLSTIGQVAAYPPALLEKHFGKNLGRHLAELASGRDPRPVQPCSRAVSIGHEETFERDIVDRDLLRPLLLAQADEASYRLRRADRLARTVTIKIKYADFRSHTRRRTLVDPTCDRVQIGRAVAELLEGVPIDDAHGPAHRVRLSGVSLSGLVDQDGCRQLTTDEGQRQRGERLSRTVDRIRDRFGGDAIARSSAPAARSPSRTVGRRGSRGAD